MSGYTVFQVGIAKGYDFTAFPEDLKKLLTIAGGKMARVERWSMEEHFGEVTSHDVDFSKRKHHEKSACEGVEMFPPLRWR